MHSTLVSRLSSRRPRATALPLAAWLLAFVAAPSFASVHALPSDLAREVLSESVPTAFAPADLATVDFAAEWVSEKGRPTAGEARILVDSLQWVRVSEVLVLPRARLRITLPANVIGSVTSGGYGQALAAEANRSVAEVPVALLSGDAYAVRVDWTDGKVSHFDRIRIRFRPGLANHARVLRDTTCSPFQLAPIAVQLTDAWAYLGCRLVQVQGPAGRTAALEVLVYWDGANDGLALGQVPLPPRLPSVWGLTLRSRPGHVTLTHAKDRIELAYRLPERVHLGTIGLGIGPYGYRFEAPQGSSSGVVPLITLYGSYFITEETRIVAFDATPVARRTYTDFGIYLNNESFRSLDRRLAFNLMLGAHVLVFGRPGGNVFQLGAPQGVELVFRDAFARNANLAAGAFIYPPIQGKLYYNAWLRWGSPAIFGEINYLEWQEKFGDDRVYSRSLGLSIGFPFLHFL
jgi:hypothetical protein